MTVRLPNEWNEPESVALSTAPGAGTSIATSIQNSGGRLVPYE